jgi:hypothetical protein
MFTVLIGAIAPLRGSIASLAYLTDWFGGYWGVSYLFFPSNALRGGLVQSLELCSLCEEICYGSVGLFG